MEEWKLVGSCTDSGLYYSRVRNKHSPTLINFLTFFQGLRPYSGLHRAYFSSINIRYKWGYANSFWQIFQGLCLFKGLRLFQTLEYGGFIFHTPLSRKFKFPAHKNKQLIQIFCSGEWFGTFCWQCDQSQNNFWD